MSNARAESQGKPVGINTERTNNLPVDLSTFIGRDSALTETRQLLTTTRLVTLTGSCGVGKTRLALRMAWYSRCKQPGRFRWVFSAKLPTIQNLGEYTDGAASYLGHTTFATGSAGRGLTRTRRGPWYVQILPTQEGV